MKKLIYEKRATKALSKHSNMATSIKAKLEQYAADPSALANNVTELVGRDGKRLRVGDFRVLFIETADTIYVEEIGPRGEVYD
jgi:mRNA interferase RelE/StbE